MFDFLKSKLVTFIISLILGGIVAASIAFLLFYLIAIFIGNFHSSWMIADLVVSAVSLIAIFAIVTKKIYSHLKRFSEIKIE